MENFNIVILSPCGNNYTACEGYQAIDATTAAEDFLEDVEEGGSVYASPFGECHACDERMEYQDCDSCGATMISPSSKEEGSF